MKTLPFRYAFAVMLTCIAALFTACSEESISVAQGGGAESQSGQGGSMARFAVKGDYLYTLDNPYVLQYYIGNPDTIIRRNEGSLQEWANGETIFASDSLLYVGSSAGMYIMDLQTLVVLGQAQHFYSCDPVVTLDTLAFVTLNTASQCRWGGGRQSELQVYSVKNPRSPYLIKTYSRDIEAPQGLAIRDTLLFLCDKGIKIFDARNALRMQMLTHIKNDESGKTIDGYDVILMDNGSTTLVVGAAGLFQYGYSLEPSLYGDMLNIKMEHLSSIVPTKSGD